MTPNFRSWPTAVDLFSGAGGLTEGLRLAGYRVLGAVENDRLACSAYRANHPSVDLWETDIRKVTGPKLQERLGLKRGELDLLAACPPCQGFSSMRTKNGGRRATDPRNNLVLDVLRLVRSLWPKLVMVENVPGLARSEWFRRLRRGLMQQGYRVKWAVLNAVNYGVPQRRRRLVLIASRVGEPRFAPPTAVMRTVRSVLWGRTSPTRSRDPLHNYPVNRSGVIRALIKRIPKNGGSRSSLGQDQLKCHQDFDGFKDVYGRMSWDRPAPTITGGCINPSKGRFLHPSADRAITLREAALLQSFRPGYRFPISDGGRYPVALLIGNALPPEFIRRHAVELRRDLTQGV